MNGPGPLCRQQNQSPPGHVIASLLEGVLRLFGTYRSRSKLKLMARMTLKFLFLAGKGNEGVDARSSFLLGLPYLGVFISATGAGAQGKYI